MSKTETNPVLRRVSGVATDADAEAEAEAAAVETLVRPPRPVPSKAAPVPTPRAPARAQAAHRRRSLLITLAVAAVVGAVYVGTRGIGRGTPSAGIELYKVTHRSFPVLLREKGELRAARSIDIRSEVEGRATIISLVPEGTHVKKGDVLVELATDETDEKIRDAEIKVALARAAAEASEKELQILRDKNASEKAKADLTLSLAEDALRKYQEGDAVQLRQADELALEKAKYVLQRAVDRLKDSEELYKQGYITRLDLENDRFEKYQAEIELKKAELALAVTNKYTLPMKLQELQAAVDEARREQARQIAAAAASESKAVADVEAKKSELKLSEDKLAKLRDQKAKSRIVAPEDGLVTYARESDWHGRDNKIIETGATVYERQQLIELPDTSKMKVVIRVHEAKTERLKVGLPASVEVEGFSGRRFTGRVSKIAVLADSRNRWMNPNLKEYETEILLDGTFKDLKPGVTAQAEILITELKDVLAVPVQAVFGKGGKYYVFVTQGREVVPVEVKVGLASNEYAEITAGLTEGQMVHLAVTDEMKLKLPEGGETADRDAPRAGDAPLAPPKEASSPTTRPGRSRGDRPASQPARPRPR